MNPQVVAIPVLSWRSFFLVIACPLLREAASLGLVEDMQAGRDSTVDRYYLIRSIALRVPTMLTPCFYDLVLIGGTYQSLQY